MLRYIYGFADTPKEIERSLMDKAGNIIDHLLYIILAPNTSTVNHWAHEIYAFISRVPKLKGKNKYPSAEQLYAWTYLKWRDSFIDNDTTMLRIIQAAQQEENIPGDFDIDIVRNNLDYACTEYFTWLCVELSANGRITPDIAKTEISEIINQL
jgi:hypothetical protein